MYKKVYSLLAILMLCVAITACGGKKAVTPESQMSQLTIGFNSAQSLETQGLPLQSDKTVTSVAGKIKVFEGQTQLFFDATGKQVADQASATALIITPSKTTLPLIVRKGKELRFEFIGHEANDAQKRNLVYGTLTATINKNDEAFLIPTHTLLDTQLVKLERRDGNNSNTITANTLVEYYLVVNASGRNDLFATIADFNAVNYLNSQGSIGVQSDIGAEVRVPLTVLPYCNTVTTQIGVEIEGYVDTNGTIERKRFFSPSQDITLVYDNGMSPEDCQVGVGIDKLPPAITVATTEIAQDGTITIKGTVGDTGSGVGYVEVFDGVRKLANAQIAFPQNSDGKGVFNFTWVWKPDNTKAQRTLRFVAYDKSNNIGEVSSTVTPNPAPAPTTGVIDELNGSTIGTAHGVTYVDALSGKGAKFSQASESRIQYGFESQIPLQGTLEFQVKIESGYNYENYTLKTNNGHAVLFTTDIQSGDVAYPGSTWLVVHNDGTVRLTMATKIRTLQDNQTITAQNTPFKFNEWHTVGISYGDQGQHIMIDGQLVASNPAHTQVLGRGGLHDRPVDLPTIGESVSAFWANNRWEGGFEGIVDRFRVSDKQKDWYISADVAK